MSKAFNPKYDKWYHRHPVSQRHEHRYCDPHGRCSRCGLRYSKNRKVDKEQQIKDLELKIVLLTDMNLLTDKGETNDTVNISNS